MKAKRLIRYGKPASNSMALNDALSLPPSAAPAMVRTQLYLTRQEYDFVQAEAARRGETMAGVVRALIDEEMAVPEDAWVNNPLLAPPVPDVSFEGREDGSINHDHYAYGAPKRYIKIAGSWVLAPAEPASEPEPTRRREGAAPRPTKR